MAETRHRRHGGDSRPRGQAISIKAGSPTLTVEPSPDADIRRYAPDSARFADAQPGSLAEIKPGDQMRVLGNPSDDGSVVKAEKIVFGTFRQLAATVISVNPADRRTPNEGSGQ